MKTMSVLIVCLIMIIKNFYAENYNIMPIVRNNFITFIGTFIVYYIFISNSRLKVFIIYIVLSVK